MEILDFFFFVFRIILIEETDKPVIIEAFTLWTLSQWQSFKNQNGQVRVKNDRKQDCGHINRLA